MAIPNTVNEHEHKGLTKFGREHYPSAGPDLRLVNLALFISPLMPGVDHSTERDSLLRSPNTNGQYGAGDPSNKDAARAPGPQELPRSTRIGILVGVWLGIFLAVRTAGGISIPSN